MMPDLGLGSLLNNTLGKGDTPPVPDYAGAAQAQGTANLNTAVANNIMNRPTENTPYGNKNWSINWTTLPDGTQVPQFTSNVNLTSQGQQLVDSDYGLKLGLMGLGKDTLGAASNELSKPLDFSVAPGAYDQNAADAYYSRATRYLDPRYQQGEENMKAELVNKGFSVGDEGYDRAVKNFDSGKDMAYGDISDRAVLTGGEMGAKARQQAIQEMLLKRQTPLTELNAVRTGAAPQIPQFQSYSSATAQPAPTFAGVQAQGGADMDIYNSQVSQRNALIGAIGRLGAGAMAL